MRSPLLLALFVLAVALCFSLLARTRSPGDGSTVPDRSESEARGTDASERERLEGLRRREVATEVSSVIDEPARPQEPAAIPPLEPEAPRAAAPDADRFSVLTPAHAARLDHFTRNLEHDDPSIQHQAAMRMAHLSIAILLESEGAAFEADGVTTQLSEDDEALFTLNGRAFRFQRSRFPFYTELQDALRASEAAVARGEASIRLDAATRGALLEAVQHARTMLER